MLCKPWMQIHECDHLELYQIGGCIFQLRFYRIQPVSPEDDEACIL